MRHKQISDDAPGCQTRYILQLEAERRDSGWSFDGKCSLLCKEEKKNKKQTNKNLMIWKEKGTSMFTVALFKLPRTWKQLRRPSIVEWIKRMCYIHATEYYSAIKKKQKLRFQEQAYGHKGWRMEEGRVREPGMDMDTLLCLTWRTSCWTAQETLLNTL